MSNTKKRTYDSESRRNKAKESKNRILSSAKKLFQRDGYELVTIEEVAKEALVSASTIYSLYKSKRGLLKALMDEALPKEEYQALVEAAVREKSPQKLLTCSAKISRQMYDAEKELMDLLRGAIVISPDLKEVEREREERRYQRQKASIEAVEGVIPKARDILWAFTGRDMYRMLVIDRGWSSDEYEIWLANSLINLLIDQTQNG